MDDIKNVDLYDLLNISSTAQTDEIKKAYRKKALSCHPDKNPDNPDAAKLFHQLTKALEVLLDEKARAAYDKVLKAKHAAELRNKELDSERKKFKETLEKQESLAAEQKAKSAQEKLQKEIERLRKEGVKQAAEESERLRKLLVEQLKEAYCANSRIKVLWKAAKDDTTNGGYNEEILEDIFSKYGKVEALVISGIKNGSALVEMDSPEAANNAVLIETGVSSNPLTLKRIGATNEKRKNKSKSDINDQPTASPTDNICEDDPATNHVKVNFDQQNFAERKNPLFTFPSASAFSNKSADTLYQETEDFEKEVLKRLKKRAEEQKLKG